MTEKQRFIKALKREKLTGPVPHFELVFYLTMEVLGKVHPSHRQIEHIWDQMSVKEKEAQLQDEAVCYTAIAEKYGHSAIFVHPSVPKDIGATKRLFEIIREQSGDEYFILMHGDTTFSMPNGDDMLEFSAQIYDERDALHEIARQRMEERLEFASGFAGTNLIDGFAMCADYCFNTNPFFTPDVFADLIAPYLKQTIDGYRSMGYYSVKHTDGNIMPILDQIADCGPDALHSIDPQAGVDLKTVKRLYGGRMCMIGNVNCGLLQTGTDAEVRADVLRSLNDGMPGYGYIFSTSNCIYTGLPLKRYEMMHALWREFGVYGE